MVKVLGPFLAVLAAGCSPELAASKPLTRPAAVLVIRHAEKPAEETDTHLSPEGRQRADALPDLFQKSPARPNPFPAPDFIFATKASAHSNRSVETVTPLAKALKLDVNAKFKSDDFAKLAGELFSNPTYAGKTVLVCWHHGTIPELTVALGATGVPDKWKDPVFDRVWVVNFDAKGKAKALERRHQALLPGDGKE